jgi:hypothetical protein
VPLADAAHAHDEPRVTIWQAALVDVRNCRGIGDAGTLDRAFVAEKGTDETPPILVEGEMWCDAVRDALCMCLEKEFEFVVAVTEPCFDVVYCLAYLGRCQLHDATDDETRTRFARAKVIVAGDEKS